MDPVIIVFAIVAAVVLYRLYTVLGQRTGHERPPRRDPFGRSDKAAARAGAEDNGKVAEDNGKVIDLQARDAAPARAGRAAGSGLEEMLAADPNFSPREFLSGAAAAYEAIVSAFAAGDKEALRGLLSDDVFESFAKVIDARAARGQTAEAQLIELEDVKLARARVSGRVARVTVDFISRQARFVKDASGNVIEGDPSRVEQVRDRWIFERDVSSPDPNWTLVATGVAA